MRIPRKLMTLFIIAVMLVTAISLSTSCADKLTKLPSPTVVLSGDTASWQAVENAVRYEISVDEGEATATTELSVQLKPGQSLRVRAVGDGKAYETGDWSKAVKYNPVYTVTFYGEDGETALNTVQAEYGSAATYNGSTPTKQETETHTFSFSHWRTESGENAESLLKSVSSSLNVYAVFDSAPKEMTVTVTVNDAELGSVSITEFTALYGATITASGSSITVGDTEITATPKLPTAYHTCFFESWSAPDTVGTETVITANFRKETNRYSVEWRSEGKLLELDENVEAGTLPTYDGATPTKAATAQYTYTFSQWTPSISEVTGNVIYNAAFSQEVNKYAVYFYDEDGSTILQKITVDYGAEAVFTEIAYKKDSVGYTYPHTGWSLSSGEDASAQLTSVTGETKVYAVYTAVPKKTTVYIINSDPSRGTVSHSELIDIDFGTPIVVKNNVITIGSYTVTATPSESNAQYTFAFDRWSTPETVGIDTTVRVSFSATVNTYKVIWKNGDTILEIDPALPYGSTPEYNGSTPEYLGNEEGKFVFSVWSPAVAPVTENVTYVAQFIDITNYYTVTFYNENGSEVLATVRVRENENAEFPGATPTKTATPRETFTFEKWITALGSDTEANLSNITIDISVYARFSSTVNTYKVSFYDKDGSLIETQRVEYGAAAEEPLLPYHEGFTFIKWDTSFSSIVSDTDITAIFEPHHTVTFIDYRNSTVKTETVLHGNNATPPSAPERELYRFVGWVGDYNNVTSDIVVWAEYVRQYKVSFYTHDGKLLSQITVDTGATVSTDSAPAIPVVEGYKAVGWSYDRSSAINSAITVNSDISIYPLYEIQTHRVKYLYPDGSSVFYLECASCSATFSISAIHNRTCDACGATDSLKLTEAVYDVNHGYPAPLPPLPASYLVTDNKERIVKNYSGLSENTTAVKNDLTVTVRYEGKFTGKAALIAEIDNENNQVTLYLYLDDGITVYGLKLAADYSNKGSIKGNIAIRDGGITVSGAGILATPDAKLEEVINSQEHTYELAFFYTEGLTQNYTAALLTVTFDKSTANISISESFVLIAESCEIAIKNGDTLEKLTPVIIYI